MLDELLEQLKAFLLEKKGMTLGLSMVLVLISGVFLWQGSSQGQEPSAAKVSQVLLESTTEESATPVSTHSETSSIFVDVKGAVAKPGVYDLPAESRVTDAIQKAGGLTAEADKQSVNLAQKLADEAVIYVAKVGENISVIPNSSPNQSQDGSTAKVSDKINLNSASLADLQTISGIGAKRAQDIIDYRDSKGGFSSVDELTQVSGIGDKTLERLKDEVTVD